MSLRYWIVSLFLFSLSLSQNIRSEERELFLRSSNANGTSEWFGEKLQLSLTGEGMYGVSVSSPLSGHFQASVVASKEVGHGLALVKLTNGEPDVRNFVAISVVAEDGVPTVRAHDCQNGVPDVLDNTGQIDDSDLDYRYSERLTGAAYAVPYKRTNGHFKILRNDVSGFFHLYYGVEKRINGKLCQDWLELAPCPDWSGSDAQYVAVPFVHNQKDGKLTLVFDQIQCEEFAPADQATHRFLAEQRTFTWAGHKGDAIVIGFDKQHCATANGQNKFVFWSEMNYVPAWHVNNELLYSYEFAETWRHKHDSDDQQLHAGCYEPMSDRLGAYTKVEVVEDLSVRKVVKYSYALVNPNYEGPYDNGGVPPRVEETYTIYPDAVGVRQIDYIQAPRGKSQYHYHELAEPMVISGSSTRPSDHITKTPAFEVFDLADHKISIDYTDKTQFPSYVRLIKTWDEQIYKARLRKSPDFFCVFSYNPQRLATAPLPIENDLTWHNTTYLFSHWPVDKQKYLGVRKGNYSSSRATWPRGQVSHSSFIGIETKEGTDWQFDYRVDDMGRKYRTYLMLFGMVPPDRDKQIKAHARTWLFEGSIDQLEGLSYAADQHNYAQRELVLKCQKKPMNAVSLRINPVARMRNPVLRISEWGSAVCELYADGKLLELGRDYLCDYVGDDLLLWINRELDHPMVLTLKARNLVWVKR